MDDRPIQSHIDECEQNAAQIIKTLVKTLGEKQGKSSADFWRAFRQYAEDAMVGQDPQLDQNGPPFGVDRLTKLEAFNVFQLRVMRPLDDKFDASNNGELQRGYVLAAILDWATKRFSNLYRIL